MVGNTDAVGGEGARRGKTAGPNTSAQTRIHDQQHTTRHERKQKAQRGRWVGERALSVHLPCAPCTDTDSGLTLTRTLTLTITLTLTLTLIMTLTQTLTLIMTLTLPLIMTLTLTLIMTLTLTLTPTLTPTLTLTLFSITRAPRAQTESSAWRGG